MKARDLKMGRSKIRYGPNDRLYDNIMSMTMTAQDKNLFLFELRVVAKIAETTAILERDFVRSPPFNEKVVFIYVIRFGANAEIIILVEK